MRDAWGQCATDSGGHRQAGGVMAQHAKGVDADSDAADVDPGQSNHSRRTEDECFRPASGSMRGTI